MSLRDEIQEDTLPAKRNDWDAIERDYPQMSIGGVCRKYNITRSALYHYARRRNWPLKESSFSKRHDWEGVEREYRAGQLTIVEISRQYGMSQRFLESHIKRYGWVRDLGDRVRSEISARLIETPDAPKEDERDTIALAAARGVQVVREHRVLIGRGQRLVELMFGELEDATHRIDEFQDALSDPDSEFDAKQRAAMLRAVALPQRSAVLVNLAAALKTLIGLERQAFNLDSASSGAASSVMAESITNSMTAKEASFAYARTIESGQPVSLLIEGERSQ